MLRNITRETWILIIILVVASCFRLWKLDLADVITDEALNGFRSIGYIDFFVSEFQKTPFDWYGAGELPSWVYWSFHDHPPLTFIIQHVFFRIGGVNLWSLRLPFVIAGIASVYLVYLLGKRLFGGRRGEMIGLTAAGLLAVNDYHVWVSRIGLQESIVIFFILLMLYFFIRALRERHYFLWMGGALGLALLSKYTSILLLPIIFVYLLIYRRDVFREKMFYYGLGVSLVLFSPVIFYNLKLFAARGHFDFQLSYLLGQEVADWQFRLGRLQAGGFGDRLETIFPAIGRGLTLSMSVVSVLVFVGGLIGLTWKKIPISKIFGKQSVVVFLVTCIIAILVMLIGFGPNERFTSLIVPFLVLLVSPILVWGYVHMRTRVHRIFFVFAAIFLFGYEVFFTVNTIFVHSYYNNNYNFHHSILKKESLSWGFNDLDEYLEQNLFSRFYPPFYFPPRYQFLKFISQSRLERDRVSGREPVNALLVYDESIASSPTVWYLFRRSVYENWPLLSSETYLNVLEQEGDGFFASQGISDIYFISISENSLLKASSEQSGVPDIFEQQLLDESASYHTISHPRIGESLRVYTVP